MQDPAPLNDPELEVVARQLAAVPPRLEPADRDALVYQCGFAAGRQSAMRGVRRWSVAAACLAIMAGGVGLMSSARKELPNAGGTAVVPAARQDDKTDPLAMQPTIVPKPACSQRDSHLPGMLLAGSSWAEIRASLESSSAQGDARANRDVGPDRPILRAGSPFNDPDIWQ